MSSVATRYLYSDRKLRDHALLQFKRALRNDRMVALTGSMADEALGYFSWEVLATKFADTAEKVLAQTEAWFDAVGVAWADENANLGAIVRRYVNELKLGRKRQDFPMDNRVAFAVVLDCFRQLRMPQLTLELAQHLRETAPSLDPRYCPHKRFRNEVAELFTSRDRGTSGSSAIRPLIESLGIVRHVTLNYDLELERAYMLREDERVQLRKSERENAASDGLSHWIGASDDRPKIAKDDIGRLSRIMGDGLLVESDIVQRKRPDRLFEFAIGSVEVDRHILHLHGRADRPDSMVFDISDYDLFYRRDDLFRNPFEHGMRVLLAGNPILFVGLGMTEQEINEKLQYFVSNARSRQMAPAFVIWNTVQHDAAKGPVEDWIETMRLDYLMRLGVHVIFDIDLTEAREQAGADDREGSWEGDWLSPPEDRTLSPDERPEPLAPLKTFRLKYHELKAKQGAAAEGSPERIAIETEMRSNLLDALQTTLRALPRTVAYLGHFMRHEGCKWRSIDDRTNVPGQPVRFWGTRELQILASKDICAWDLQKKVPLKNAGLVGEERDGPIFLGLAEAGSGRGLLAERIARSPGEVELGNWRFNVSKPEDRLLINAGFCYDSDSVLNAIKGFLVNRVPPDALPSKEKVCREREFALGRLFETKPSLIILNGVDRFFGINGAPLSAEFDYLFRCIMEHHARAMQNGGQKPPLLQWLVLGTERIRAYFEALAITPIPIDDALEAQRAKCELIERRKSLYLSHLEHSYNERAKEAFYKKNKPSHGWTTVAKLTEASAAKLDYATQIDGESTRRAFYAGFLSPIFFSRLGDKVQCAIIFEILRTMAFIGAPCEGFVLLRCPKVSAIIKERRKPTNDKATERELTTTLREMLALGLIIEIEPAVQFKDGVDIQPEGEFLWRRVGLHRSLATELRERHGAPITEAKLSTSFNMSLFAAQPEDRYSPERRFHNELGELVDRLIGSWKDCPDPKKFDVSQAEFEKHPDARFIVTNRNAAGRYRAFQQLSNRRSAACLRAAMSIVRGYYSTGNLLTLQRDAEDDQRSMGALTEHGDRLDRLLRNFGKVATARRIYLEITNPDDNASHERKSKIAAKQRAHLGAEPLYPDDFVWLHNERGVVKLVQGNLYASRRSFSLARQANQRVEPGYHGHNWRRISINIVGLMIERGRLARAERLLDEIDATVDRAPWARTSQQASPAEERRVTRIRRWFGDPEKGIVEENSPEFAREEILIVGLTTAYRGLIDHMRGEFREADVHYRTGLLMLRRLKESRAYAMFQRHFASLGGSLLPRPERLREINLAVAAADATQQMDIAHRARVLRAMAIRADRNESAANHRFALQDLRDALEYATNTDSYRVRIEASSALAREMRLSGDYDTALRYAADALAVASRYGHSLHKIWLRVEIGQIFLRRGDEESGNALLDAAARSATRTGYQRTIEHIKRARTQAFGDGHSHSVRDTLARHV